MRILIAPDSFKDSLSAFEVAQAMKTGASKVLPEADIDLCPMADGGEGTVEALVEASGGKLVCGMFCGPLGEDIQSCWGLLKGGKTAVVEMAATAGLQLVPDDLRNPEDTTSYGVGQQIKAALDAGVREIIIAAGGSATTDGGAGALQALGVRFFDSEGEIRCPFTGRMLYGLEGVDSSELDKRLKNVPLRLACDVENPLCGKNGSAAIYGPQKGASPEQVEKLDAGLRNLAKLFPSGDPDLPGSGAAGGLPFGLKSVAWADFERGIDLVMDAVSFNEKLARADLVLTGEGRLDSQTLSGKTVFGILKKTSAANVPLIAFAGKVEQGAENLTEQGLLACFSISNGAMNLQEALLHAAPMLEESVRNALACFAYDKRISR